jgi:hypothetical protein
VQIVFFGACADFPQLAKEHDVIAWWRSTVPGHVECAQYTVRKAMLWLRRQLKLTSSQLKTIAPTISQL